MMLRPKVEIRRSTKHVLRALDDYADMKLWLAQNDRQANAASARIEGEEFVFVFEGFSGWPKAQEFDQKFDQPVYSEMEEVTSNGFKIKMTNPFEPEALQFPGEDAAFSIKDYGSFQPDWVIYKGAKERWVEVWREGYLVTGMGGVPEKAAKLWEGKARDLNDAVQKLVCTLDEDQRKDYRHDERGWTWWGCRLFDNKADARRVFG